MKLMIIESPGKIKKLTEILSDDWKIVASIGHVRDLPVNEMGVEAPNFVPQYELTERGESTVAKIKNLVRQADSVYLATDPDREGESISWHLQQCLQLKNPLRITFGEITPNVVKAAILNPRSINTKRVAAQEARRVLDRLVGYMVSPKLSQINGENLSAGRVQSVAVLLVVEREREIQVFKPTKHFGAKVIFADAKNGTKWEAEWVKKGSFVSEDSPYFMDRDVANRVAGLRVFSVTSYVETTKKRSPPPPFTTSTLQQAASVKLGFDPARTMELAQKLYEQGHISYHRTDNPNVSEESLGDIYAVATEAGLEMADKPRKFEAPEGAQAGHPAITPTHWDVVSAGDDEDQIALYSLIRLRAIACQLADAEYAVRTVKLVSDEIIADKKIAFEASGKTLVYPGWLKLVNGDQTDEDDETVEADNPVPALCIDDDLFASDGKLIEIDTRAPKRYTQASLIKKLEAEKIGRPATYAAIMENIVARGYVVNQKKALLPTERGELVVDSLTGIFDFMNVQFTRSVESDLDKIEQGGTTYKEVVTDVHERLLMDLNRFASTAKPRYPCALCGLPLRRIKGKSDYFWGCSGHPNCTVTLPDEGGKPGQPRNANVSQFHCRKCEQPLVQKKTGGNGGFKVWVCTRFAEGCKTTYADVAGKPAFPK